MLPSEQWQVRHAALIAISVVAEGLREQFVANIQEICTQVNKDLLFLFLLLDLNVMCGVVGAVVWRSASACALGGVHGRRTDVLRLRS